MDAIESQPDAVAEARIQKLEAELSELRGWVGQVLIGCVAAFLGIGAFFGFQVSQSGKELESRAVVHQQIQLEQAKFDAVVEQLRKFGGNHPDYAPILQRHGIDVPSGSASAPVPLKAVQPVKK